MRGRVCGRDRKKKKYHEEFPSYIKRLLSSLFYVGFYNHIKSSMLVSLQAGGCCIKKKAGETACNSQKTCSLNLHMHPSRGSVHQDLDPEGKVVLPCL